MAPKSPRAAKTKVSAPTESRQTKWESLTWDDMANWAGSRSVTRGRAHQRGRRVRDLGISAEGKLQATVAGGRRYATGVWWEADRLRSRCTCPVGWNGCKHAVAVVATYLDFLAKSAEIPIADTEDGRWEELASGVPEEPNEDDLEDDDDSEDDEGLQPIYQRRTGKDRATDDEKIRKHIDTKSREDLADLVWSLTRRFPDLREEFRERIALGEGDADHGSPEEWAAKCAAQQKALIESDTRPRTIEASTTHQDEPLALPEPPAICEPADASTVEPEPVPVPVAPSWAAPAHQTAPTPYYGPPVLPWEPQAMPVPANAPEPISESWTPPAHQLQAPAWRARA